MWLDGSSTSSDLISEVSSIKYSEITELDFVDNSDNVGDSTVQVVEVSVHHGPVGVTFPQAPTMNTMVPAPHSVNVCAFAASGPHCQCTTSCLEYKCSSTNARSGTV